MLTILDSLPARLLETPANELHHIVSGPTLIHLPGRRPAPLFVSVLLHGNEDSGYVALQRVLRKLAGRPLPRALSMLVGNVAGARAGVRRLDQQPDYNRVWPGNDRYHDTAEHAAMTEVYRTMRARIPFASIDFHNNTGINPPYSVVNRLDQPVLHLSALFSRTVVWFRGLPGSQTNAFSALCPSLTVECGTPGVPAHEEHAARFLDACLHLAAFPTHEVRENEIDLYHTLATVRVLPGVSFAFGNPLADVNFEPQLDHLNFQQLAAGTVFGRTRLSRPLEVRDENGADVTSEFFACADGAIALRRAATPAMLTVDRRAVQQDCLCYLMDRLPLSQREHTLRELCATV